MKNIIIKSIPVLIGFLVILSSCRDDLLDQPSRNELPTSYYWKTVEDAESALNGAVADIRYVFDRDYYLDGHGEFVKVNGQTFGSSLVAGAAYRGLYWTNPIGYGSGYDNLYECCFGGVNRANYVIDGVEHMLETTTDPTTYAQLEAINAEAKVFRSLVYLKLMSMWGDVPYIDYRIYDKEEAEHLSRTPIAQIKDSLVADLTYAYEKLPIKAAKVGRLAKPAALALRGKVQLYWASWNRFGWPELTTFTPSADEARKAYEAAAKDFYEVSFNSGLDLYKNGEPGDCDPLGKAVNLPNYYYLFTPKANGDSEFIIAFNHGGTGTGQGDELMRNFAGRSLEYSQAWIIPRFAIGSRYQRISTGEFDPLVPMNPADGGRTMESSATNPESYEDRDYRMKSSIMWDYEMCMGMMYQKETTWVPYIFRSNAQQVIIDGVEYTSYESDNSVIAGSGYAFRKFVRNYSAGQDRSSGDYNWPVIRLADVFLMYAEAVNELNNMGVSVSLIDNGTNAVSRADAINLINRIRHRGNLPALKSTKTDTYEAFFSAIEQERIVELLAEGHRGFDIRRWRAIERIWCPPSDPNGVRVYDTWGSQTDHFFQNQNNRAYESCYIFRIPPGERDKNPNLTQNKPFL